jgi:hypothetical protein
MNMKFRKYMHLEKVGNLEVEDILLGTVYVFPKLDGTNSIVWMGDDNTICCGSRTRQLTIDNDNAGFMAYITSDTGNPIREAVSKYSDYYFYGEWLVPHTFKGYRENAWRRFWLFDIYDAKQNKYLPYDTIATIANVYNLDIITCSAIIDHPSEEQLIHMLDTNTFLVQDGIGSGEGIVLKNYLFTNRFNRTCWAKMVRSEFKDANKKLFGVKPTDGTMTVERRIVEKYITEVFVKKERSKIEEMLVSEHITDMYVYGETLYTIDKRLEFLNQRKIRSKLIPRLIQTVFYELVREHAWDMVKEYKCPTINFKQLEKLCTMAVKHHAKDLF